METPANAVVVAIGRDGYDAALRFGLDEADRIHRPLLLVHVLQLPAGDGYVGVLGQAREEARVLLANAATEAAALAPPGTQISTQLVESGWVVDGLVRHVDGACVLVLQHRALGRLKRAVVRSVAHGAAGRARVPVVSVPHGWHPRSEPAGVVTAAVQDPDEAEVVLRAALERARALSAELVVLHAWWLDSGYDVVEGADLRDAWTARSLEELEPVLAPLREEFPDVRVTLSVRHAPPVEAVLDAAEVSSLLVLGRRHHLLPLASHLGPVARAALDHAPCPVLVAPERTAPTHPVQAHGAHPERARMADSDAP